MKIPIAILDRFLKKFTCAATMLGSSLRRLHAKVDSNSGNVDDSPGIREQLDAVYGSDPDSSRMDPLLTQLQIRSLPEDDW